MKEEKKICKICNKEFYKIIRKTNYRKFYCSDECAKKAMHQSRLKYQKKMSKNLKMDRKKLQYDKVQNIKNAHRELYGENPDFYKLKKLCNESGVRYNWNELKEKNYKWLIIYEKEKEEQLKKEQKQQRKIILEIVEKHKDLDDREKKIINYRFKEYKTLQEVGNIFKITRERVRQIEMKALNKVT